MYRCTKIVHLKEKSTHYTYVIAMVSQYLYGFRFWITLYMSPARYIINLFLSLCRWKFLSQISHLSSPRNRLPIWLGSKYRVTQIKTCIFNRNLLFSSFVYILKLPFKIGNSKGIIVWIIIGQFQKQQFHLDDPVGK